MVFLSRAIDTPIPAIRSMLDASCANAIVRKSEERQRQRLDLENSSKVLSPTSSSRTSISSQLYSSQNAESSTPFSQLPPSLHGTSVRSMKGVSFDRSKRNWEASWLDSRTGRRVKKCFSEGRWG